MNIDSYNCIEQQFNNALKHITMKYSKSIFNTIFII